jgi:hypothetical protein
VKLRLLRLGGAADLHGLGLRGAAPGEQQHGYEKQWRAHRSNLRS